MTPSESIQSIHASLAEYEATPDSRGLELRLNLAEIVIRRLKELRWTQEKLAHLTSINRAHISSIIHSNSNCTFNTIGRVLFALDVHVRFEVVDDTSQTSRDAARQSARTRYAGKVGGHDAEV